MPSSSLATPLMDTKLHRFLSLFSTKGKKMFFCSKQSELSFNFENLFCFEIFRRWSFTIVSLGSACADVLCGLQCFTACFMMLWPLRLLTTSCACFLVYLLFKCAFPLFLLWHKHYFCCIDLCLSLSDVNRVRMSGCAAMCIFKRCATSRCLGWRRKLCISSEFVLWTKPGQDAHPKPRRPSWPEILWSTPGRRVWCIRVVTCLSN